MPKIHQPSRERRCHPPKGCWGLPSLTRLPSCRRRNEKNEAPTGRETLPRTWNSLGSAFQTSSAVRWHGRGQEEAQINPVVAGIHSPRRRLFKGEESEQNSPSLLRGALFPRGLPTLPRCLSSSTGAAFQPMFPRGGVHCPLLNRRMRGDLPAAPAKPGPYCPGSFPICNGSHRRVWHMPGCRLQRLAARRFNDLQPILFP